VRSAYKRGWYGESHRHYLAAIGVSTGHAYYRQRPGRIGKVGDTLIIAQKLKPGRVYPVTGEDVKKVLQKIPEDDRKGLKAVEFVEPRTEPQKGAWAQLIRSKKKMLIFSQPREEVECDPEGVRAHMKEYVIPHEVGHHVALNRRGRTDKDLSKAEARADAYAAGMDVEDKDVVHFKKRHEN